MAAAFWVGQPIVTPDTPSSTVRSIDDTTPAGRWSADYARDAAAGGTRRNRSGLVVAPLYTAVDLPLDETATGYPGQAPYMRGIHASMYRGRPWSQRLIVGLGLPEDYNERMRTLYASGAHGLYVAPCNSHMRGYDADEVDAALLGTCGTVINTVEDLEICLRELPFATTSVSLGDSAPFTLSAMLLVLARRQGLCCHQLSGTTNQSDYLSHYAALHMFMRLSLAGARRMLIDHIEYMVRSVPRWYPISIVGQHMQEAGATPAQAMAFALCSAIQHADDLVERGLDPDVFLPKFSFFFDVSMSFFEEIAKFRAGRIIWSRIARERYGAKNPRSCQLRFHAQTAGTDLTRQQPLNNIARVAVQAIAAIFGGAQSLHTDAWDEAFGAPSADAARIAIDTQAILRQEALLDHVIDPLGGAYFLERQTTDMAALIEKIMADIAAAGGMYAAVANGRVQALIGAAALDFQAAIDEDPRRVAGIDDGGEAMTDMLVPASVQRPDSERIAAYLERLRQWKRRRDQPGVERALDEFGAAFSKPDDNVYERVVMAVEAGATHGEICRQARVAAGAAAPLVTI